MDFSTPKIEQPKSNVLGISGFVISILSFLFGWFPIFGWLLWIVGLGLSIAGAFKTPRGLAVAGIIISVITIALYITLTIMVLNFFDGDVERLIREVEAWD